MQKESSDLLTPHLIFFDYFLKVKRSHFNILNFRKFIYDDQGSTATVTFNFIKKKKKKTVKEEEAIYRISRTVNRKKKKKH
jgi:hypothetical protein